MATYTYPVTHSFKSTNTYVKRIALDSFLNYVIPVPFTDNDPYFMPFTPDDELTFCQNEAVTQVQFYEQCSEDEIVQLDAVTIDGNCFTIDFSRFDDSVKCFRIKVNGQGLEYGFTRADDTCRDTLTIESFYDTFDSLGYNYLAGYSNKMRLYAELEHVGEEKTTNKDDEKLISTTVYSIYELRLMEGLRQGSFALQKLLKSVLLGNDITVVWEGNTYVFEPHEDNVNKDNDQDTDWYSIIKLRMKSSTQNYIC